MKEFLKPLWLLQLFPKPRAEAPDGPIHYLTEGKEREKENKVSEEEEKQADDIRNL